MSRHGAVVPGLFPARHDRPAPTYPEHGQLRADAEAALAADGGFVDPAKLRASRAIARGYDWRLAVLGHDHPPRAVEMHMLLLADQRGLEPPLPQWAVDAREEVRRRDEQAAAARQRRDDADQAAWDAARAGCPVELEVHRNGKARARNNYLHHLGHAVPAVDAESGSARRPRRHLAGRALCETEKRTKPLDLSGGTGGAATCESCLEYAPKIRPAVAPDA